MSQIALEEWRAPDIPIGLQHVSRELLSTWLSDIALLAQYAQVLGANSVAAGGGSTPGIRPVALGGGDMLVGTIGGVMPLTGDGITMIIDGMPRRVSTGAAVVFNLAIRGLL